MRLPLALLLTSVVAATTACPPVANDDAVPPEEPTPVVRQVATWNMRFFPSTAQSVQRAADVIAEEGWDVLAMQELFEPGAVSDLIAAVPGTEALVFPEPAGRALSVGILWRSEAFALVDGGPVTELTADFDRVPMSASLRATGSDIVVRFIAVHLSSGIEAAAEAARLDEVAALEAFIRADVDNGDRVIILGDYNEAPSDPRYAEVLAPFFGSPERYTVLSRVLQQPADATFLPSGVILDQVTVTTNLVPVVGSGVDVVHLNERFADYEATMSDHLPLHLTLTLPATPGG